MTFNQTQMTGVYAIAFAVSLAFCKKPAYLHYDNSIMRSHLLKCLHKISKQARKKLGPILFLVFINDLPEHIKSKVRLFADDTAVYLAVSNLEHAQILQEDLDRLAKWSSEWDMEFNPSKCTVIHVTRSKSIVPSKYTLYGQVLESVSSSKYLGVTLNDHLTWNDHIQNTVTSANKTLGFLRRNIRTKDSSISRSGK